jgi:hypothetical protein
MKTKIGIGCEYDKALRLNSLTFLSLSLVMILVLFALIALQLNMNSIKASRLSSVVEQLSCK